MQPLAFLQKKRERYGDVFTVRLMGEQPLLVVSDPELVRQVFAAPADVLCAGEGNGRVLDWLYGDYSLILLDGERHIRHRRLLLPAFHGRRLERQAETMRAQAEAQLDAWPTEEEVVALPRLRLLTLEVVLRAVLGGGDEGWLHALRDAMLAMSPADAGDGDSPTFKGSKRHAEALVGEEVVRRRGDSRAGERDDVLSLLLEARYDDGPPLSDAEIRDELLTLLIAGGETTAASLAWALERLARDPSALARAAAEAEGGGGPYTDAVIHETLRMRPAVPMSARFVKRPFQMGERSISPGAVIALSALLIHHRADLYPEPLAFRPERFLERRPGTYTWIPFGGGTRRCIGARFALLEMRIVLSALLSRMTPRAADPEPEGMRNRANTVVPARGARVVLESRRSGAAPLDRAFGR
jgi:cytochrome P450 family 135